MTMLLIETSTERGFVAILKEQKILYHQELPFGYNNSSHLLPCIEEGLNQLSLKVSDLDCIAVGIGPGSYTGIRVGVVAAKGLAYAAKLPLVGISSLIGFIPDKEGNFAAIIDAKISGAYLLTGKCVAGNITYTSEPKLYSLENLLEPLKDIELLVSPVCTLLRSKLEILYPQKHWEWIERYPVPLHMAKIAYENWQSGHYSSDAHLEILYLRKTQAEIERDK